MDLSVLENHKYIKLIEFSLKNNYFTGQQACSNSGLTKREFEFVKDKIFVLSIAQTDEHYHENTAYSWKLSPEVFFNYLQYSEFKFAVKTANKAHNTAVLAIIISGLLALGALIQNSGIN